MNPMATTKMTVSCRRSPSVSRIGCPEYAMMAAAAVEMTAATAIGRARVIHEIWFTCRIESPRRR